MNWHDLLTAAPPWAAVAGLGVWFVRDRKKDKAAAEVAEQTVAPQVAQVDLAAREAGLAYVAKAFAEERASYERRIQDLEDENKELRVQVAGLRNDVDELRGQLRTLTHQTDRGSTP